MKDLKKRLNDAEEILNIIQKDSNPTYLYTLVKDYNKTYNK